MKTRKLKGNCYILELGEEADQPLVPVINTRTGAKHISQYHMSLQDEASSVLHFGKSDVTLFIIRGNMDIEISGEIFSAGPEEGLYIRPGEAFQARPKEKGPVRALITVCPEGEGPQMLEDMPQNFDKNLPKRLFSQSSERRESMGDRFFQVLLSKETGSNLVTQFIGEIPRSKANSHHHLYEEAIYILSGEGYMWNEGKKGRVRGGDIVFLPKKQEHSLECTTEEGMRIVGHFYPAGSPAENY